MKSYNKFWLLLPTVMFCCGVTAPSEAKVCFLVGLESQCGREEGEVTKAKKCDDLGYKVNPEECINSGGKPRGGVCGEFYERCDFMCDLERYPFTITNLGDEYEIPSNAEKCEDFDDYGNKITHYNIKVCKSKFKYLAYQDYETDPALEDFEDSDYYDDLYEDYNVNYLNKAKDMLDGHSRNLETCGKHYGYYKDIVYANIGGDSCVEMYGLQESNIKLTDSSMDHYLEHDIIGLETSTGFVRYSGCNCDTDYYKHREGEFYANAFKTRKCEGSNGTFHLLDECSGNYQDDGVFASNCATGQVIRATYDGDNGLKCHLCAKKTCEDMGYYSNEASCESMANGFSCHQITINNQLSSNDEKTTCYVSYGLYEDTAFVMESLKKHDRIEVVKKGSYGNFYCYKKSGQCQVNDVMFDSGSNKEICIAPSSLGDIKRVDVADGRAFLDNRVHESIVTASKEENGKTQLRVLTALPSSFEWSSAKQKFIPIDFDADKLSMLTKDELALVEMRDGETLVSSSDIKDKWFVISAYGPSYYGYRKQGGLYPHRGATVKNESNIECNLTMWIEEYAKSLWLRGTYGITTVDGPNRTNLNPGALETVTVDMKDSYNTKLPALGGGIEGTTLKILKNDSCVVCYNSYYGTIQGTCPETTRVNYSFQTSYNPEITKSICPYGLVYFAKWVELGGETVAPKVCGDYSGYYNEKSQCEVGLPNGYHCGTETKNPTTYGCYKRIANTCTYYGYHADCSTDSPNGDACHNNNPHTVKLGDSMGTCYDCRAATCSEMGYVEGGYPIMPAYCNKGGVTCYFTVAYCPLSNTRQECVRVER